MALLSPRSYEDVINSSGTHRNSLSCFKQYRCDPRMHTMLFILSRFCDSIARSYCLFAGDLQLAIDVCSPSGTRPSSSFSYSHVIRLHLFTLRHSLLYEQYRCAICLFLRFPFTFASNSFTFMHVYHNNSSSFSPRPPPDHFARHTRTTTTTTSWTRSADSHDHGSTSPHKRKRGACWSLRLFHATRSSNTTRP